VRAATLYHRRAIAGVIRTGPDLPLPLRRRPLRRQATNGLNIPHHSTCSPHIHRRGSRQRSTLVDRHLSIIQVPRPQIPGTAAVLSMLRIMAKPTRRRFRVVGLELREFCILLLFNDDPDELFSSKCICSPGPCYCGANSNS
jgi:hypothetical protein